MTDYDLIKRPKLNKWKSEYEHMLEDIVKRSPGLDSCKLFLVTYAKRVAEKYSETYNKYSFESKCAFLKEIYDEQLAKYVLRTANTPGFVGLTVPSANDDAINTIKNYAARKWDYK